jgi:poly(3-hydroxybutyrate) depolymerase
MDIEGTAREYYVVLPNDYKADRPYPVVFQWHPLGGNAEGGMNMYGIRPNMPDAIYVTPDGLPSLGGTSQGFDNANQGDEKLTRAIMKDIEAKYCVDKARYFATGFSFGGSMSYTCACNMSDVFRAVAGMAGAPISGAKCGSQPPANKVAWWGTHGTNDTALPMSMAIPIRDAFITKNGCEMTSKAVEPSPCVQYDGCDDGYPVVWCEREGDGHAIPMFSRTAIPAFFKQF